MGGCKGGCKGNAGHSGTMVDGEDLDVEGVGGRGGSVGRFGSDAGLGGSEFAGFLGGSVNEGLGEFLQHQPNFAGEPSGRTSNFQFQSNLGMGLDGGVIGPRICRGGFQLYGDGGMSSMYSAESGSDWGSSGRVEAGMPASWRLQGNEGAVIANHEDVVDSEGRVEGVNVNLALNGRNMY
jgi:hypothetical protein